MKLHSYSLRALIPYRLRHFINHLLTYFHKYEAYIAEHNNSHIKLMQLNITKNVNIMKIVSNRHVN